MYHCEHICVPTHDYTHKHTNKGEENVSKWLAGHFHIEMYMFVFSLVNRFKK